MNNTYGTIKPSVINPTLDVEIWYRYTPTRSNNDSNFEKFRKIENNMVPTMLKQSQVVEGDVVARDASLPGMYNLSLPASIFSAIGFYTIYIKPKEIICRIYDVSTLSSYSDVRGIIINTDDLDTTDKTLFTSDNLTGYRIEYFEPSTTGGVMERQQYYRLITSCNYCEAVSQNLTSAYSSSPGYRYNDSGSLSFLTVSPSTSPTFRGASKPFIGSPSQQISISNTKFDPVMLEIEICENDFDTLTTIMTGNQIRSLDNGLLTTYNKDGEIFNQYEFYTLKDNYTQNDKFEVKKQRTNNIDFSANYSEIISN